MPEILKPDFSNGLWASGGAVVTPSNTKIQTGWGAEVPPYQWENYTQLRQDQGIAHILQHGISVWDALTEYQATRSYVQGSNGIVYRSVQTSVGQNPLTDTSNIYWVPAHTGRLVRTTVYSRSGANQVVSVNGSTPTTTGAASFTPMVGSVFYIAEAVGGGGGSGGTTTTTSQQWSLTGGGSGGVYGRRWDTIPSTPQNVSVGTGGVAGAVGANGGPGGATTMGTLLSVGGGSFSASNAATQGNSVYGGATTSFSTSGANMFASNGGYGTYGISLALFISGTGGSSFFGPGGPAVLATNPGQAGISPGSGAGGACSTPSSTGQTGGKGADGLLIIYEYA